MFGKKKVHKYNSRNYDLTNTKDFNEFYDLVDVINEFDFAIDNVMILYTMDGKQKANIHVETKSETIEIWLRKKGFEEA